MSTDTPQVDYTTILSRRFPDSEWTLNGESYDGLIWLSSDAKPSKDELDSMWSETLQMIVDEKQAKVDARQQALAKLEALGLTPDEVTTLFGINPS